MKERKKPSDYSMERSFDTLSKRAMSEFPISIGTGLAIEALKGVKGYESLWINVRTMFRNIYETCEKDTRRDVIPEAIADTIIEEWKLIKKHLGINVYLYSLDYSKLNKEYPKALLRDPYQGGTPLQIQKQAKMDEVVACLEYYHKEHVTWEQGSQLTGEPTKSLIITHNAVDLLSRTKFKQLRLLESYTGAIKSRSQWSTKLTNGKNISFLPFNKFTIQIFGDGNNQFNQYGIKVRDPVLAMALENNWTPVTTTDKIRWNIRKMADQFSAKILSGFL